MSPSPTFSCTDTRLTLSARRDGLEHDGEALTHHLAACSACAEFERELELVSAGFHALSAEAPPTALWARIEARLAPPRPVLSRPRLLARIAAVLLAFLGAHFAARALEPRPGARAHLLARWLAPAPGADERARLHASPEYRLLLTRLPNPENER
jgi:hypothetical protein